MVRFEQRSRKRAVLNGMILLRQARERVILARCLACHTILGRMLAAARPCVARLRLGHRPCALRCRLRAHRVISQEPAAGVRQYCKVSLLADRFSEAIVRLLQRLHREMCTSRRLIRTNRC
eukprot:568978-Pleurochrysis_carterae.AAC.2